MDFGEYCGGSPSLLPQREFGTIRAPEFPAPPGAVAAFRRQIGEPVIVHQCANEPGRGVGKRIVLQESNHVRRTAQQPLAEAQEPRVAAVILERREPHLPVQPRLMRRHKRRRAKHVAGFVPKLIRAPVRAIDAAFDDDLGPRGRHDGEQSVAVDAAQRTRQGEQASEWRRPGEKPAE